MDRSFAPRLPGTRTVSRGRPRSVTHLDRVRGAWASLRRHRRLRSLTIAILIAAPLLVGGWLGLRDSSLVSVRHVHISGAHGVGARAIDRALSEAARNMSTMDVNLHALRSAVAAYPQVRRLQVKTSFPHSISISVIEQLPVATLLVGSERTALAADGVVLGPDFVSSGLPVIRGAELPQKHVTEAQTRAYLAILGAAPAPLERLLSRVFTSQKGITLQTRNGMLIYFGDATRPHAKWLSFVRVLIAPSAAGATYIDVRLPERPAAGMPGEGSAQTDSQSSGLDPTSAALAASLASAVKGETSPSSSATTGTAVTPAAGENETSTPANTSSTPEATSSATELPTTSQP
jgi:cell division protein FtsQ